MPIVDTRGELCPKPLIMAKKALNEMAPGEKIEVITDSETSLNNLTTFLSALKTDPHFEKDGNQWHVHATKPLNSELEDLSPDDYCETTNSEGFGNYVIVIKSNQMGQGDEDLGKILIRGFINALKEQDHLPTHIIFYNSGVQLTVEGTDTAASLAELENRGVTIVVCGTCVDFYDLKGKIGVGMISNMLYITTLLQETNKIITP